MAAPTKFATPMVSTTLLIPRFMRKRLREIARQRRIPVSEIFRQLVERHFAELDAAKAESEGQLGEKVMMDDSKQGQMS